MLVNCSRVVLKPIVYLRLDVDGMADTEKKKTEETVGQTL